jgi:hypothetical protein
MGLHAKILTDISKESIPIRGFGSPSIFIRDKPVFSSERMLRKDCYRKGLVAKKSLVVGLKGPDARKPIGGKSPVAK